MTNVMHKFLIYLSINFCLTCFGLSFNPYSEAGLQLRQWVKSPGYGVSALHEMYNFDKFTTNLKILVGATSSLSVLYTPGKLLQKSQRKLQLFILFLTT
jgi:hypothetical protein